MPTILDGKGLSIERSRKLEQKVAKLSLKLKIKPKLLIIQIGDIKESNTYIKNKINFGNKIGVLVEHKKYQSDVYQEEVIKDILKYNLDQNVHGIIVQLPVPKNLDPINIIDAVDPRKDVDGLTSRNTKLLVGNSEVLSKIFLKNNKGITPATPKGIITLLEYYKIGIEGKKVVIVGQSALVGRPTALTFLNKKATVTVCHKKTKNLAAETKQADILVVAAGHPGLITSKHVSRKQVVIDVGITVLKAKKGEIKNRVVGDVDFEAVSRIVAAISPVPGGVGPMTVVSLFENLIEATGQNISGLK